MQVKDLILEYLNQPYFKSAVAFFFLFFLNRTSIGNGQQGISYNSLVPTTHTQLSIAIRMIGAMNDKMK